MVLNTENRELTAAEIDLVAGGKGKEKVESKIRGGQS